MKEQCDMYLHTTIWYFVEPGLLQLQLKALCGGSLTALHIDESEFLPIRLWQKIAPVQSDGMESNCEEQFSSSVR